MPLAGWELCLCADLKQDRVSEQARFWEPGVGPISGVDKRSSGKTKSDKRPTLTGLGDIHLGLLPFWLGRGWGEAVLGEILGSTLQETYVERNM